MLVSLVVGSNGCGHDLASCWLKIGSMVATEVATSLHVCRVGLLPLLLCSRDRGHLRSLPWMLYCTISSFLAQIACFSSRFLCLCKIHNYRGLDMKITKKNS